MPSLRLQIAFLICLFSTSSLAQTNSIASQNDSDIEDLDRSKVIDAYRNSQPRELTVLAETLAAEEIDRAVLNRLMQEISTDPEGTQARIGINTVQLQEIFITISNARGFINGSESQNVQAMCSAWESSAAMGEERIAQALAAYTAREQLTKTFIAKYYSVVLHDIESLLDETSLSRFNAYMDDRRRRLANAGIKSWGAPVQNISAGTDTINFHCR